MLTLSRRCEWRDIDLQIDHIDLDEPNKKFADCDIFFIGGGQDAQQERVAEDLKKRKEELKAVVEDNAVLLAICGGYQMLGEFYQTGEGKNIPGLGILDVHTKAPKDEEPRLIGNVVAECLLDRLQGKTLVGFENHSGRTLFTMPARRDISALAIINKGFGNNDLDETEGAVYKNVIGTYLHGSLLPKNPHLADELILRAMERKYPDYKKLPELDDSFENDAHEAALALK